MDVMSALTFNGFNPSMPSLIYRPKNSDLEIKYDSNENWYIDSKVMIDVRNDRNLCLYTGYLKVMIPEDYAVDILLDPHTPENPPDENIPQLSDDQDRIRHSFDGWKDSTYMTNEFNVNFMKKRSNSYFSDGCQSSSKNVTVQYHNTYITQNVYNFNQAPCYGHYEQMRNDMKPQLVKISEKCTNHYPHLDAVYDCRVVLSPLHERYMDGNIQSVDKILKYREHSNRDNEAHKQLISPAIQSGSKQQMVDIYVDPEDHLGPTIQQIAYNDPTLKCSSSPMHIGSEVVIESSEPPPKKKYQCAKCRLVFESLSDLKNHMSGHVTDAPRPSRYRDKRRTPVQFNYVCCTCGKTIHDKDKFERHCMAHGNPDLECPTCGKVFATKYTRRVHERIHNRKYHCSYCTRTYEEKEDLIKHLGKYHRRYNCDSCDFIGNDTELSQHRNVHKYVNIPPLNEPSGTESGLDDDEDDNGFRSPEKTSKFPDWTFEDYELRLSNEFEANLKENRILDDIDFSHGICIGRNDEKESRINEYSRHDPYEKTLVQNMYDREITKNGLQRAENGSQTGYESQVDEYANDSTDQFDEFCQYDDEDLQAYMNEDDSSCDSAQAYNDSVIAKAISHKAFLATKLRKCKGKHSKMCNICPKRFDRMSDLKRHLIEHVIRCTLAKMPLNKKGILNINCEVCHNHIFNKVDDYKVHLREHANLTLYRCSFCNKSFSDSSNFSKHKKIHGSTFFQCDLCHRKFNSRKMLTRHMEYHNENSPMPCPFCNKKFHFESMLNKHIKASHTKQSCNRFRCKFCLKYSSSLKEKWDHEWVAHKARKMIVDCLLCGAKYRKYSELKRHCHSAHDLVLPSAKNVLNGAYKKSVCYKKPF